MNFLIHHIRVFILNVFFSCDIMGDRGIGSKGKGVFGSPGKEEKIAKMGEGMEMSPEPGSSADIMQGIKGLMVDLKRELKEDFQKMDLENKRQVAKEMGELKDEVEKAVQAAEAAKNKVEEVQKKMEDDKARHGGALPFREP